MVDDTGEIRAAAEHFLRVFDALDWEAFAACWATDPTAFFPGDAARLDGRAAVLARFRAMFDEVPRRAPGPRYLRLEPRNLRVDRHGDVGLVTFTLAGLPGPVPLRSLLFVREAGAWRLAHLHATHHVLQEPGPPSR
jgi:ketosteroid isomerase-like protein